MCSRLQIGLLSGGLEPPGHCCESQHQVFVLEIPARKSSYGYSCACPRPPHRQTVLSSRAPSRRGLGRILPASPLRLKPLVFCTKRTPLFPHSCLLSWSLNARGCATSLESMSVVALHPLGPRGFPERSDSKRQMGQSGWRASAFLFCASPGLAVLQLVSSDTSGCS